MAGINDEGFYEDEFGQWWGWCNNCGEEVAMESECCSGGEVVPYESEEVWCAEHGQNCPYGCVR